MNEFVSKAKQYGVYLMAGVGVLALAVVAVKYFWPAPTPIPYGYGGGATMNKFLTPEMQPNSSPFPEGQLTQRRVVKNASLDLLVKKAEDTAREVEKMIQDLGGFVSYSDIYEISEGTKGGNVTIRVSVNKLGLALEAIRKLAIKVQRESINSQDVTEQYVDLEARLKNAQAEEAQYLQIMKQSQNVKDTLEVASRLADVRLRIEQIQGQLKYLSQQVDLSLISVSLTEEADVQVFGLRWRPLFVIKQQLRQALNGLTNYVDSVISFIFNLPVLILWLVSCGLLVWTGWKTLIWIKKRF
jgi:hypothetical protein